ncbi:MAG: 2,3-bisphosphoglycerate-independent phosphoglycerate mutase [Candidatus Sumerlaeia bacterium]
MADKKKTTLLLVLDGWGIIPEDYPKEKSAIALADTPYWDEMVKTWPMEPISTSGNAVGLPEGIMGNSEVGHLNLGAGRIVWQPLTRIDKEIEKDGLKSVEALVKAIEKARDNGSKLHLMGLVSDGGVHSIDRHYFAILRLAKSLDMPSDRVIFHAFMDGRDTAPSSGKGYMQELEDAMQKEDLGRVATVSGRYFAMDRDKRWDRVKKAYDAMVRNEAEHTAKSGVDAMQKAYDRDETDEFVTPTLIVDENDKPVGRIESGDQAIFFNFRPDRARQMSHALVDEKFDSFDRVEDLDIELTTMTQYEDDLNATVAFPPHNVEKPLGEIVADAGMTQLRIAETEKYAHVTYFFSGGREKEFDGEDRIMVPSPKVATYDLQPEMSLPEVSEKLAEAIKSGKYDLIVCNFANGDMVGHTGDIEAAKKAAEAVDKALKLVIGAILETGGQALVTADHGNAERMWNFEEDCPDTQHTTTPTPCMIVSEAFKDAKLRKDGVLGDVAPTVLEMMGKPPKPELMTGKSLFV